MRMAQRDARYAARALCDARRATRQTPPANSTEAPSWSGRTGHVEHRRQSESGEFRNSREYVNARDARSRWIS